TPATPLGFLSGHTTPQRGPPDAIGRDHAVLAETFEDEPNRLVADTGQGPPDIGQPEDGGSVANHVLAHTFLFGVDIPRCRGAIGEDVVRASDHWARDASGTMTPSMADEAVMLATRAPCASSARIPGSWSR